MSDSLQPHGLQHTRLPYTLSSPGIYPSSCPLNWWRHPTILFSIAYFSSCPQCLPASGWFFSSESALCIRWSKFWSFSISHSDEYSGLISFRIDWFDLLEVQRTLKILLQHHSSKAPILLHFAFYMVQLSHLYMITWKDHAFTIWTFVGKVCLCFLTLSRFIIAFLLRNKCPSWVTL